MDIFKWSKITTNTHLFNPRKRLYNVEGCIFACDWSFSGVYLIILIAHIHFLDKQENVQWAVSYSAESDFVLAIW